MVGLMDTASRTAIPTDLARRIDSLKGNEHFVRSTVRATADKDAVTARINAAIEAFRDGPV